MVTAETVCVQWKADICEQEHHPLLLMFVKTFVEMVYLLGREQLAIVMMGTL